MLLQHCSHRTQSVVIRREAQDCSWTPWSSLDAAGFMYPFNVDLTALLGLVWRNMLSPPCHEYFVPQQDMSTMAFS